MFKKFVLLMKLRDAIADKEWTTACANMEMSRSGGWSCDWHQGMREAQERIDKILVELER